MTKVMLMNCDVAVNDFAQTEVGVPTSCPSWARCQTQISHVRLGFNLQETLNWLGEASCHHGGMMRKVMWWWILLRKPSPHLHHLKAPRTRRQRLSPSSSQDLRAVFKLFLSFSAFVHKVVQTSVPSSGSEAGG